MKLGLNLSFAVKRWMIPQELAKLCKELGAKYIQFTWDLCDPWWPEEQRDKIAREYADAFRAEGLELTGTFGGLAAYSFPQLLAPLPEMREVSMTFFKRAIDMTRAMGTDVIGTPLGGMDYLHTNDPVERENRYQEMLGLVRELADYGAKKGLREIMIEATPLATEFPHSPEAAVKLMKDLDGSTAIPVRLLIAYVSAIHLQQCDGLLDRHWDFTNENGIITPELIRTVTHNAGADDIVQYLEVVTAFEAFDEDVLKGMRETMKLLGEVFAE